MKQLMDDDDVVFSIIFLKHCMLTLSTMYIETILTLSKEVSEKTRNIRNIDG